MYGLLLGVGLLHGMVLRVLFHGAEVQSDRVLLSDTLSQVVFIEVIFADVLFSGAILFGFFWIPRPSRFVRPSLIGGTGVWTAAIPLLGLLLAGNFSYHALLRDALGLPPDQNIQDLLTDVMPNQFVLVAVMCLQPALFEELFFRHTMLGALRPTTGIHAAVWITSMAFALTHLGQLLALPVLFVIGLALGYLRVASGSLILPMFVHFLHNAAVLWMNS